MTTNSTTKITKISTPRNLPAIRYMNILQEEKGSAVVYSDFAAIVCILFIFVTLLISSCQDS